MHYGHPDVFDRIFHITRGGISKASRVINISEDIYAGELKSEICHLFVDFGSCVTYKSFILQSMPLYLFYA